MRFVLVAYFLTVGRLGYFAKNPFAKSLIPTSENNLQFKLSYSPTLQERLPRFLSDIHILFLASTQQLRTTLRVEATSSTSGYIAAPGFPFTLIPKHMCASHTIRVPLHQSVMISFVRQQDIDYQPTQSKFGQITLSKLHFSGTATIIWKKNGVLKTAPALYNSSINIHLDTWMPAVGFKAHFTFHPQHALPRRLHSGLFNCSVSYYVTFKDHLHCNLKQECQGREDEGGHCPFSSAACDGKMDMAGIKCFSFHVAKQKISWLDARKLCQARSGQLAILRSYKEVGVFMKMLRIANKGDEAYIGLLLDTTVPNLYRKSWRWIDNSILYLSYNVLSQMAEQMACYAFNLNAFTLYCKQMDNPSISSYACEHTIENQTEVHLSPAKVKFPCTEISERVINYTRGAFQFKAHPSLVACPGGYWTHDFLKCDMQAACLVRQFELHCPVSGTVAEERRLKKKHVRMFACGSLIHTIPYTLVCNFTPDCMDASDETFCHHEQNICNLSQHQCASHQCVSFRDFEFSVRCDRVSDCDDESDEASCGSFQSPDLKHLAVNQPARIDIDRFYIMKATKLYDPNTCPDTHFKCPGHFSYCLPVYVLCNGYYDCPQREDEMGCETYTCPGLYRCRGSSVCVHVTHVCDDVAQCEGRDDEMLCAFSCPHHCQCQGLAFVCHQSFHAGGFPQIRYLDASHSLMKIADFVNHYYLVWLSLHSCELKTFTNISLANLQTLDVSDNMIKSLEIDSLQHLPNLKEIRLSNNPLEKLTRQDSNMKGGLLEKIDLSKTHPVEFDCDLFSGFPMVNALNFSHCGKVGTTNKMLTCFKHLRELDVRGTHLVQDELSLVGDLQHIETVFSDNYRHCCPAVLPDVQHKVFCLAPDSGFSSCSHLLRLPFHRACLWVMAALSFLGNACYLALRNVCGKNISNPSVFVINLIVANLIMGIYLCIIIVADLYFQGNFLLHERAWKEGDVCKIAGFMALLSSEMSCLIVCLLSVDRCLVVCFNCRRFHVKSVWLVCLFSWLTAAALSSSPLFLPTGEGGRRTSLCIPVPSLENDGQHTAFFLGVLVVFKTVALITAVSQAFVRYQVRTTYTLVSCGQVCQDMVLARRVMTLLVTDVIWRIGISVAGLLAHFLSSDIFMMMFVLGLPLKQVLNPLLYTNALLKEKRKRKETSRLLTLIKRRVRPNVKQTTAKSNTNRLVSSPANQEDVLRYLRHCLQSEILSDMDVEAVVTEHDHSQG